MENYYIKSLQIINLFQIKTEKEYNKLLQNYLILNLESLKYISQTRNFKEILKIAKNLNSKS